MYQPPIQDNIDDSHSSKDFFARQEARERVKQEALKQLEDYADLARRPFVVDIDGRVGFLKPIAAIYGALRKYLDLPVEENNLRRVVIYQAESATHSSLALETINFLARLQQAITDVESRPLLTAANYTALYWQFLYPLYRSCERVVKANFWPTYPLVESIRWLSYEVTKGSSATAEAMKTPLLTSLAYTLLTYYLDSTSDTQDGRCKVVVASYGQLPYRLQLELLEAITTPSIQAWVVSRYPDESLRDLLSTLRAYRNEDGSSVQQLADYETWLELANQLLAIKPVVEESQLEYSGRTNDIRIRLRDMRFINERVQVHQADVVEYRIKTALYPQFLAQDPQQRYAFKPKENKVGRHTVYPIHLNENRGSRPGLWMKLLPEQPGTEFAIYRLAERLGLGGVVPGVVGNIRLNGKDKGQAVWISADAGWQSEQIGEIKNLAEVIEKEPELLNKIDMPSLTRAILRVLWSNPEDDKGNDYLLIPFMKDGELRYKIVRIDNERAFFPVEKQETIGLMFSQTVLQVKSLLYCLTQMQQPLEKDVLKDFAALDMYQVLKAWLNELQLEHQRYKELFTETEVKQHFSRDSEDLTLLAVMLHKKLMPELLGRLQLIQYTIRMAMDRKENLTGLELLRHVQPALVSKGQETYYYAKAFSDYPKVNQAKERFNQLTKGQYSTTSSQVNQVSLKSAALSAQQSLRLERSLTVADVLESLADKQYSPSQAQAQLEQLANSNASDIWHKILYGPIQFQPQALTAFGELPIKQRATLIAQASKSLIKNPDAYTQEQQEAILKAIATTNWQTLALSVFAHVLTPALFQAIIQKTASTLVHLNIAQCLQLGNAEIVLIAEQCYSLESLDISELPIKQLTISQPWVGVWLLPKLTVLTVRYCQNLRFIDIQLPALKRLEAEDCIQLKTLKAVVPLSARSILKGCDQLSHAALKSILFLTSMGDEPFFDKLWALMPQLIRIALQQYMRKEVVDKIEKVILSADNHEALILRHGVVIILSQLPIKLLDLSYKQIGDKGVEFLLQALERNSSLTELNLSDNQIGNKGIKFLSQALERNRGLKKLNLRDNQIGDKGIKYLSQALERNSSLTELHLSNNQIGNIGVKLLSEALLYNERLITLDLIGNPIGHKYESGEENIKQYLADKDMPNKSFRTTNTLFSRNTLDDDSTNDKKTVHKEEIKEWLEELKEYIADNRNKRYATLPAVTNNFNMSISFLPASFKLPSLSEQLDYLNLTNSQVNDKAIDQLVAACKHYSRLALKQLILANNTITTTGLKQLAQELIPNLSCLTHLNLADNQFDEFGLAALINAFVSANLFLHFLDISGNAIGDSGMQILADYLMTNTSLQSLGIRDTSFSDGNGYPRLLACFKKNFTLVTVDIDISGNLLLSPASQTQLTQFLKRNQDLQPVILRLRKAQTNYLNVLQRVANKAIPLFNQKKIGDLNTMQALLEQLRLLWEPIEGDYTIIKLAIKKEGNDESHPLLNALNKAQQQQRELEKHCRDHEAQLSQPDYYPAWQRNRITIRIWQPGVFTQQVDGKYAFQLESAEYNAVNYVMDKTHRNIGHVSVATTEQYLSLWPAEDNSREERSLNTLQEDEIQEGPDKRSRKLADTTIVLFSVDAENIQQKIINFKTSCVRYKVEGNKEKSWWGTTKNKTKEATVVANCCDAVISVVDDEIKKLAPSQDTRLYGISAPTKVLTWLRAAQAEEEKRYPFTKTFNTLSRLERTQRGQLVDGNFVITRDAVLLPAVRTVCDFISCRDDELSFTTGCVLQVLGEDIYDGIDGYSCRLGEKRGWVNKVHTQPAVLKTKVACDGAGFLHFTNNDILIVLYEIDNDHYYCRHSLNGKEGKVSKSIVAWQDEVASSSLKNRH